MATRRAVVLGLTILGILILVWNVKEDGEAARWVLAAGCFLIAIIYAQMTLPRGRV